MKALKVNGLERNTLVVFTSDNGPWITFGNHAGKTPSAKQKRHLLTEVPSACIMKFPGKIPAGKVSDEVFCTIDLMPTICHLTGAKLPDNEIDGMNVSDIIMSKPGVVNPHEYYAFSTGMTFEAVMSGDGQWKLHVPHDYQTLVYAGKDGMPGQYKQAHLDLSLFDMKNDPYETQNVIDKYPDVAKKMEK